jgi:hypothetical protein
LRRLVTPGPAPPARPPPSPPGRRPGRGDVGEQACAPADRRLVRLVGGIRDPALRGVLDGHWSGWFEGLQVSSDAPGQTLITGPVADQAALHGLLAKVRDLGLPLLSVRQISPGYESEKEP